MFFNFISGSLTNPMLILNYSIFLLFKLYSIEFSKGMQWWFLSLLRRIHAHNSTTKKINLLCINKWYKLRLAAFNSVPIASYCRDYCYCCPHFLRYSGDASAKSCLITTDLDCHLHQSLSPIHSRCCLGEA